MSYLDAPLTLEEIKVRAKNGRIKGTIKVTLAEVIARDLEFFMDLLNERLTGDVLLTNMDYSVTGSGYGTDLYIAVSGDTDVLDEPVTVRPDTASEMAKKRYGENGPNEIGNRIAKRLNARED